MYSLRQSKQSIPEGRILGRNWDKSLKNFHPCYSQSPLLREITPPPPPRNKNGLKLVWNVNIVYGYLKSENSQDYAQEPRRNCTFMNSASRHQTTQKNWCLQTTWPQQDVPKRHYNLNKVSPTILTTLKRRLSYSTIREPMKLPPDTRDNPDKKSPNLDKKFWKH